MTNYSQRVPNPRGIVSALARSQIRLGQRFAALSQPHILGYFFVAPWFIGFIVFTLGPFLASIYLSFVDWALLGSPKFVGFGNYKTMFLDDVRYRSALGNTLIYVFASVPLKQVIAL